MNLDEKLAAAIALTAFVVLSSCHGVSARQPSPEAERQKQGVTMHHMHLLEGLIRLHRTDFLKDPAHLDQMVRAYESDPILTKDGWGRDFYYYSTGETYVLASFGRNGMPASSRCEPGCIADAVPPDSLYDLDIVMINGDWAQTLAGLDR